jgi:hypothetical protein
VKLSWQRRLGISLSAIWLLLWLVGYLADPYKTWRDMAFGLTLLGLLPILLLWFGWWVWDAYKKS